MSLIFQLIADRSARREVRKLIVFCTNKGYGCNWQGPWKDLEVSWCLTRAFFLYIIDADKRRLPLLKCFPLRKVLSQQWFVIMVNQELLVICVKLNSSTKQNSIYKTKFNPQNRTAWRSGIRSISRLLPTPTTGTNRSSWKIKSGSSQVKSNDSSYFFIKSYVWPLNETILIKSKCSNGIWWRKRHYKNKNMHLGRCL